MASFSNRQLKLKVKTWTRDSYGLYDYENSNLQVQNLTISEECRLSRVGNQITTTEPPLNFNSQSKADGKESHKRGSSCLISINETEEGIKISPNKSDPEDMDEDFWNIVERGETAKGYMLNVNDVIKLGRVMFKINQIRVVDGNEAVNCPQKKIVIDSIKAHMQKGEKNIEENGKIQRKMSYSEAVCKICLSEKAEEGDPLISPCGCTGSVKYVHLQCIQNWVKSKLNMQQNKNIITIFWKNLFCELCKEKFPMSIEYNNEEVSLLPIADKISGSYIAIESFSKAKDSMGMHIIDLSSNQAFKMGRGHECDLKIPDISVSRVHALLVVSQGKVYLKDNMSKFGTLVLQKEPFVLNDENVETPWVQCGRSVFKFNSKKSWTSFLPSVSSFFGLNKLPKLSKIFGDDKNQQEDTTHQYSQGAEDLKF